MKTHRAISTSYLRDGEFTVKLAQTTEFKDGVKEHHFEFAIIKNGRQLCYRACGSLAEMLMDAAGELRAAKGETR